MERQILGVRLEPETFEALDIKAERTGHTRASLARYFIRRGLRVSEPHAHLAGEDEHVASTPSGPTARAGPLGDDSEASPLSEAAP